MSTTLTDKNSNGFPARSGVAAGDFISSAEMNQHLDALGERTNYLYTMGIYPHNATFNYPIGAFCQVNGTVYRAQVAKCGQAAREQSELLGEMPDDQRRNYR